MKHVVFMILVLCCAIGCAHAGPEALSWDGRTTLDTNAAMPALNALANNPTTNRAERARAVFTLFANYIKSGQTAEDVHRVLTDTTWLESAHVDGVYMLAGWIPVEIGSGGTVFCVHLFADKKGLSDWVIYFRISGSSDWREEDASAFLRGKSLVGNPKLIEFALCFPHLASPGHLPGRIERFGKQGIHVYDPW